MTKHKRCPVKVLRSVKVVQDGRLDEPMTCQETGGPMSDVRQGPVKWHAILGYELLWRKSPEATESFEAKAIFFFCLFFFFQWCHRVGGERVGMHIRD